MATSTIKTTANVDDVLHITISGSNLEKPLDTEDTICSFERIGKNALITFRGKNRSHAENEVFLKIPEGYRCSANRYYAGIIGTTGAIILMKANGDVSVWSTSPPNGRLTVQMPYMIN